MSSFLWQTYHRLIHELSVPIRRFLYNELAITDRLTGIIGPRGVGKTTLLLQFLKDNYYAEGNAFYFSADNTYFNETSILEFVDRLYQQQNIRVFFIDEIHMYANWSQELKNIYDSFPKISVFFSGSSSIDLVKGSYDLSRRARILHMPGLSFREFLMMKTGNVFEPITLDELLSNHQVLAAKYSKTTSILQYFEEYMRFGYYPIVFENRDVLYSALSSVVEKTIYEDISNLYPLKTNNLNHFKRILNFFASIPPGKITINNLARKLQIDNKTAAHYLNILNETGLIKILYPVAHGGQLLTKPEKVYLDNGTLLAAMNTFLSGELSLGALRELVFFQFVSGAGFEAFYPKVGDFQINDTLFEIGGRNKTWEQLKNYQGKKILVKDNILVGFKHEIPLYLFGFLY